LNNELPGTYNLIHILCTEQFMNLICLLYIFLKQLVKDYQAWATGDTSRQPLGTGEI